MSVITTSKTPFIAFNGYDKSNRQKWKVGVINDIVNNIDNYLNKEYVYDKIKDFEEYYFSEAFDKLFSLYDELIMERNNTPDIYNYLVETPVYIDIYIDIPIITYGLIDRDMKYYYLYKDNIRNYFDEYTKTIKHNIYDNENYNIVEYTPVIVVNNCVPNTCIDYVHDEDGSYSWKVGLLSYTNNENYFDYLKINEIWHLKTKDFKICDTYKEAKKMVLELYDELQIKQKEDIKTNKNKYLLNRPRQLEFIYDRDFIIYPGQEIEDTYVWRFTPYGI